MKKKLKIIAVTVVIATVGIAILLELRPPSVNEISNTASDRIKDRDPSMRKDLISRGDPLAFVVSKSIRAHRKSSDDPINDVAIFVEVIATSKELSKFEVVIGHQRVTPSISSGRSIDSMLEMAELKYAVTIKQLMSNHSILISKDGKSHILFNPQELQEFNRGYSKLEAEGRTTIDFGRIVRF